MSEYKPDRGRVDRAVRQSGVVVVMNKKHIKTPEDMVTTMYEVYQAGFIAECTFRIDAGILKDAMQELCVRRAQSSADSPFILGVGSVINPSELETAIEMGFDMVVAPANVMGGYGEGKDFVRTCRQADVFCAPAIFTPSELQYFIERPDALEPDAVKVFPANSHGPNGIKGLLAPYVRQRHAGRIIMPTGGVNCETGPQYQQAILASGFTPVLGMSAPLSLVEKEQKPGDVEVIRRSLAQFKKKFQSCYSGGSK
ncbi:MAG TPA: bifunctional 4-hydroxy-2-oxoglutarate aldolase/2-dehydro-3-deoxy-phosphogluconate aldolase [Phycisphaerales bacterium]|nr:bifunctional 4-hydroxy-2-oxoglutarate aldolase/2-dehydro-3-deoxy-phosphogluconate aldolase [Phycisphaerales bacterium]